MNVKLFQGSVKELHTLCKTIVPNRDIGSRVVDPSLYVDPSRYVVLRRRVGIRRIILSDSSKSVMTAVPG